MFFITGSSFGVRLTLKGAPCQSMWVSGEDVDFGGFKVNERLSSISLPFLENKKGAFIL